MRFNTEKALETVKLGEWCFDPDTLSLWRQNERKQLSPLIGRLLKYLTSNAQTTCTREQLLDDLWHQETASDEALSQAISELRRALDDSPRRSQYIQTMPRVGYRWVAAIDRAVDSATRSSRRLGFSLPRSRFAPGLLATALLIAATALVAAWPNVDAPLRLSDVMAVAITDRFETLPSLSADGRTLAQTVRGSVHDDWDIEVFKNAEDGNRLIRRFNQPGNESGAVVSADGTQIAYFRGMGQERSLVVVDIESNSEQVWAAPGGEALDTPTFSKSGKRVYWLTADTVERVDVDVRQRTSVPYSQTGTFTRSHPALSPDDPILAVIQHDVVLQSSRIELLDLDGHTLATSRHFGSIADLHWMGPRQLVLSAGDRWQQGLWSVQIDDQFQFDFNRIDHRGSGSLALAGERIVLTEQGVDRDLILTSNGQRWRWTSPADEFSPAIAPDGRHIVFVSDRSGTRELWLATVDGQHVSRLTHLNNCRTAAANPRFSAVSEWIEFDVVEGDVVSTDRVAWVSLVVPDSQSSLAASEATVRLIEEQSDLYTATLSSRQDRG